MSKNATQHPSHKQIIFLRHAKAEKATWGQPDFERPLAARGIEDALKLCEYLEQNPITPDVIVCSPALRTRQTLHVLQEKIATLPAPSFLPDLYLASAGDLLQLINEQDAASNNILIIGHNPGLADIILQLTHHAKAADRTALTHKFSTCGLAILSFPDTHTWADIIPDSATLDAYIYPKMLNCCVKSTATL